MERDFDVGKSSFSEKIPSGDSVCEIEITSEMIEAGVDAYGGYFIRLAEGDDEIAREMVCAVFCAMIAAPPGRL